MIEFSVFFAALQAELLTGRPCNDGSSVLIGARIDKIIGHCQAELFTEANFLSPNKEVLTRATNDAYKHRIAFYQRILTISDAFSAICDPGGLLFSFHLFPSFKDASNNGIVPLPCDNEKVIEEHCVHIYGYDMNQGYVYPDGRTAKGFFHFANSWGESWGNKGHGYLPFEYFEKYSTEVLTYGFKPTYLAFPERHKRTFRGKDVFIHEYVALGYTYSHPNIKVFELYVQSKIVSYVIVSKTTQGVELIDNYTLPEYQIWGYDDFIFDYWINSERSLKIKKLYGWISRDDFNDGWNIVTKKYTDRGFKCTKDNKYPWARCYIEKDL